MSRAGITGASAKAAWIGLAVLCLIGSARAAEPVDYDRQLREADGIKTSNNVEFVAQLHRFDDVSGNLSLPQQLYLQYLQGWQDAYEGKYETAISLLDGVIDKSDNTILKFRAGITAVNALAVATHYQQGYSRLSQLLELLPQVSDNEARSQGLVVAAVLYNQAGQYDLALNYANKLLEERDSPRAKCQGLQLRAEALYKTGKLRPESDEFQQALDSCTKAGELLYANYTRTFIANLLLQSGRAKEAIDLLREHFPEVQRSHYARALSEYDSLLSEAYEQTGDLAQAQSFAQKAIDDGVKNQIAKPMVDAYRVQYEIARKQGDFQTALAAHEKYAAADKGYLNDESAKALAFQMVHQQVQEKKAQVEVLSKQNQLLQLKQQVDAKTAEAGKLLILLLLTLGGSVALYAFRTKRSEVKFMKLARRDGLTDIYNRQYFVEAAGQELQYCQKSMRDVSVIVIDLDHFKNINDTHGHAAGDFALKRAVAMCQAHLRSVDVFGRLGGEEFGILMPDCVPERAADQAELMRLSIERLINTEEGPEFPVRASFGISAARWSGYDLRQLLAHADSALYQAKREGRNRVVVYAGAAANSEPPPGLPDRRRTMPYTAREDVRR